MNKRIKKIFLTGLAVTIPIGLTVYILFFIISIMDNLLKIIPYRLHPENIVGFHIPGLGIIFTVVLIFFVGLITQSYTGNVAVKASERLFSRIPFVRQLYTAIKQIFNSLFIDKGRGFRSVVLVEFPRKDMHSIGFLTSSMANTYPQLADAKNRVGVYIPFALAPYTGMLVMVHQDEVIRLDMTIEEAFTLIISAGVVPPQKENRGEAV